MSEALPWLASAVQYLESWLEHQVRLAEIPGCSIAVRYRGKLLLDRAFGVASMVTGEPLTSRHRFRVASHSKAFTAAGVLRLCDEGRLRLDDPLGAYLTGLHTDFASATVAQLLSNGAGAVRDGTDSRYWSGRRPFATREEVHRDFTHAASIPVNSRLKYSNLGFALGGLLIEAVTGEDHVSWVEREIIAASKLTETDADYHPADPRPLASGHGTRFLLGERPLFRGDIATEALAPAAGVVSTAADLTSFFYQLSPTADHSFLSLAARREMSRGQRPDAYATKAQFYGLGTMSGEEVGWSWFGHGGGFQGYITRTAVVPDRHLAISILTNSLDGKAHAWVDGALAILAFFEKYPAPEPQLADWTGRWWNVWGAVDLVARGDRLYLASPDANDPFDHCPVATMDAPDRARIIEASAFHHYGEAIRLKRDSSGQTTALHIAGDHWSAEAELASELRTAARPSPDRG